MKIAFLGDSLVEYCNWSAFFNNIVNYGVAGDTTLDVLDRLDNISEKRLFLLIGVNDFLQGYTLDEAFSNYLEILEKLKDKEITIISLIPVCKSCNIDNLNEKNRAFNEKLKSLNYQYMDIHKLLLNEKGFLNDSLSYDGLHLNQAGYKIFIEKIRDSL